MIDLRNYRIIKYSYTLSNDGLTEELWEKMDSQEVRWATKLVMDSVCASSTGDDNPAWDIFFTEIKLEDRINQMLLKYNIEYVMEDITDFLIKDINKFEIDFIKKLDEYLDGILTTDDILDNIIEVGIDKMSIFEKYYLDKHKDD